MSDIREYEEKMKKSVEALKEDYTTIRATIVSEYGG